MRAYRARGLRAWLVFTGVFFGISMTGGAIEESPSVEDTVIGVVFGLIVGGLIAGRAAWCKVGAGPEGIVVRNPFRTYRRLGWDDVARFYAARHRFWISGWVETRDGRDIVLWGLPLHRGDETKGQPGWALGQLRAYLRAVRLGQAWDDIPDTQPPDWRGRTPAAR